jgi:hypothetical protein
MGSMGSGPVNRRGPSQDAAFLESESLGRLGVSQFVSNIRFNIILSDTIGVLCFV